MVQRHDTHQCWYNDPQNCYGRQKRRRVIMAWTGQSTSLWAQLPMTKDTKNLFVCAGMTWSLIANAKDASPCQIALPFSTDATIIIGAFISGSCLCSSKSALGLSNGNLAGSRSSSEQLQYWRWLRPIQTVEVPRREWYAVLQRCVYRSRRHGWTTAETRPRRIKPTQMNTTVNAKRLLKNGFLPGIKFWSHLMIILIDDRL